MSEILIIIGTGVGLGIFARVSYSIGYGKGFQAGLDHFHSRYIDRIKARTQTRDGQPEVFRG